MKRRTSAPTGARTVRCAIYTRKSTEEGLAQEFNSLDAQRESAEAFIKSQAHEGWVCLPDRYDDGGFTGGNMDRPALRRLIADVEAGKVDCVVVYKVDRLSRSLLDFARMMETFETNNISFVSVTQQFNTTHSMGRLTLNILLSFAQFEREIISERTRDKIAAARRKGKWSGGMPLLGYDVEKTKLVVNPEEADRVRQIFHLYMELGALLPVVAELNRRGWTTKRWPTKRGTVRGGKEFNKTVLHQLLTNPAYIGKVRYKSEVHDGEHEPIVDEALFNQVQKRLMGNGRDGGSAVRNKHGALLRGLLRCANCDCAMSHSYSSRGTKRYRYYTCTRAQKQGFATCESPTVPAGEIERFVVEQIRCVGQDPALVRETLDQLAKQNQETIQRLAAEERTLVRDLKGFHVDVQRAAVDPQSVDRLADLHERIRCAERRLTEVREDLLALESQTVDEADVARALAQFDPVWEALSPREQARLLELLVERVEYDGENVSITFRATGIRELAAQPGEAA